MKPLLVLDIDGTLLPHPEGALVVPDAPVGLSGRQAAHVIELSKRADLVWASLRTTRVTSLLSAELGVEAQAITFSLRHEGLRSQNFKTEQVARWVAVRGGRPFVWADDLVTDADRRYLAGAEMLGPHLVVAADPHIGLTEEQWDGIGQWVEDSWRVVPLERPRRLLPWMR